MQVFFTAKCYETILKIIIFRIVPGRFDDLPEATRREVSKNKW